MSIVLRAVGVPILVLVYNIYAMAKDVSLAALIFIIEPVDTLETPVI